MPCDMMVPNETKCIDTYNNQNKNKYNMANQEGFI